MARALALLALVLAVAASAQAQEPVDPGQQSPAGPAPPPDPDAILIDPGGGAAIGKVTLVAPRGGCRSRPFSARVEGNGITGVAWRLDGRGLDRGPRTRVPIRALKPGVHRLVAVVSFGSGATGPVKRLTLRFRRCR